MVLTHDGPWWPSWPQKEELLALVIQEKDDSVRGLLTTVKDRDYLLHDEVNDILPAPGHAADERDDLFSAFEAEGNHIYEGAPAPDTLLAKMDIAEPAELGLQE